MILFTLAALGLLITVIAAPLFLAVTGVRQYRWWSSEGPGGRWHLAREPRLPPPPHKTPGQRLPRSSR